MRYKLFSLSFCLFLLGCQPGSGEFAVEDETDPEPPVVQGSLLTQIQDTVFTPICSECHIGSQAPVGLRLENTDVAFEFLVDVPAVGNSDFDRVTPNDSVNSFLMLKITGDPRAGQRMPLGRMALTDESIQLIRDWIDQGALPAEDSRVLTKIRSVKPLMASTQEEHFIAKNYQYEVNFTQPVDRHSISKNSLMLYQDFQGSAFLVSEADYEIEVITERVLILTITNLQLSVESISLVINDPSGNSVLDMKGRILDGDNDQIEGGRYEFKFQTERSN